LRFLGFLIIMGIRWSGASQKVNRVLTKAAGTKMILGAALLCGLGGCVAAPIPVDIVVENVAVYSGTASAPVVASVAIRDGKFLSIDLANA
jgi:hypothetical protein